ncbi:MAG: hypothetical protein QM702_20825 [Rubrivivax sp.]
MAAVCFAAACSSSSDGSGAAPKNDPPSDDTPGDPGDDAGPTPTPGKDAGKDAADASPPIPVGVATKIVEGPVRDYALVSDGILVIESGVVKKRSLEGAGATTFAGLPNAGVLSVDGARVYAINSSASIVSATLAGADPQTHATNVTDTYAFRVSGDAAYVSKGFEDDAVGIVKIPLDGSARSTIFSVNARSHAPVFAAGRVFALDYGKPAPIGQSRDGGLWFNTGGATSTRFLIGEFGAIGSFGSITTDGTDVYARTAQGIVKWPAASLSAGAAGTVVVPKASCTVSGYTAEDVIAVDSSGVYAVCDGVAKASYEIRAYTKFGQLTKILGTVPVSGYGYIEKLRTTATKVLLHEPRERLLALQRPEVTHARAR